MTYQTITPHEAHEWLKSGEAILVDVREPEEFASSHIIYAQSLPLSSIESHISSLQLPENIKIITQCLSGKRGEKACVLINSLNTHQPVFNIEGGISSWQAAGLPTIGQRTPKFSIFRQIQIIVGGLILSLIILGFWGLTLAFAIAGLFAGALMFAGITGWCGLAMILRHMPWNK
jgi:rhodanese-related sulfurtransferase